MNWISKFVTRDGCLNKEYIKNHFPKTIGIELTNICSHKCIHCPKSLGKKYPRNLGHMDFKLVKKIVDEAVGLGCEEISFCQDGDVAMAKHKVVIDSIKYIVSKKKNMKITLVTNGFGLDKEFSKAILGIDANYRITFDLYAATSKKFKEITQIDAFSKCRDNIIYFMNLKKDYKKDLPISLQALDYINKEEQKKFIELGKSIGFKKINIQRLHPYPGMPLTELGAESPPENGLRFPCGQPFVAMNVFYTGDVTVCCLNYGKMYVGNVNQNNLEEIWNGKKWNEIRIKHINNDFEGLICKNCNTWYVQQKLFYKNYREKIGYYLKILPSYLKHKLS